MSKPQRTLMLVTPYFPPQGGELERYAKHIAGRLHAGYDWRVVMVCAGEHHGADSQESVDGLTVYRLGYAFKLSNTPFDLSWRRKLRDIIRTEQPDLINAHMPVPGLADVAARCAGRIPFVLTYHTSSMKKGASRLVDTLIGAYEKLVLPFTLRRARRIICSSDYVRDEFLGRYASKTVTITPGVDEHLFVPTKRLKPAAKTIIFVGNYGPSYHHKGLLDLVQILPALRATFPNLTLKVVGDGDAQYYRDLAAPLGVANAVEFVGLKSSAELAKLYPQADLVALPSRNDSFPMVLVEAMASGIPVVSTTVGGIPTVVDHGKTGLLTTPGNLDELTAAITRILSDPALAQRFGAASRQKILDKLTWDRQAAVTNELFESVMKPHICQVTAYFPPHIGGIENVVQELTATLTAAGYTAEVITSRGAMAPTAADTAGSATIHRLASFDLLHTPVMPGLFGRLLRLPAGTVIHLHIAQAFIPEVTWLAANLRGLPLISHIHLDVDPSSAVGQIIFRPYKRLFLRFVLRHSDRVICLSADQRELMIRKYQLDPQRVLVLPNGVSPQYFLPARRTAHTPLRLLFVGRLALQKRPERIVEAMTTLTNVHLDVVGDGDHRPRLEAFAREHHLTNITFHGIQRGADLQAFYQAADVLVMTSDKEGMSLVLLEAMASALPIVAADVAGIRELIGGVGVLVAQPSAITFATAIRNLQENPAQLTQLSQASRTAAEPYSWKRLAEQVGIIYTEVQK